MKTSLKIALSCVFIPMVIHAQQRILLTEQAGQRIVLVDVAARRIVWEWKPSSSNVDTADWRWFSNPSDAKPVYDGRYILAVASGGGVALIRLADHRTVFYGYAGGNPHSAELLPDGNIVVASSTANYLTVFRVDTSGKTPAPYSSRLYIEFGHNVVWDRRRQLLWSADKHQLKTFRYNFDYEHPALQPVDSMPLPGSQYHDLFPTLNGDTLWMTNTTHVYKLDVVSRRMIRAATPQKNVKSISSAPGYPTLVSIPQERWWTDELTDIHGNVLFKQHGLRIYKARWFVDNTFSYP